jgi:iron complex transport system permease protein
MMLSATIETIVGNRNRRARNYNLVITILLAVVAVALALTLVMGQSFTPPKDVIRVLLGEDVAGATFTVGQLRLPRAVLSILAGLSFGLGGVAFQIMLRNPLASPDIIGISSGASAAAVFAIAVLSLKGPVVSLFAVVAGLGVALLVYALSFRNGVAGTRLILVGIGVSGMLESFIAYILSTAPSWNLQEAMRR